MQAAKVTPTELVSWPFLKAIEILFLVLLAVGVLVWMAKRQRTTLPQAVTDVLGVRPIQLLPGLPAINRLAGGFAGNVIQNGMFGPADPSLGAKADSNTARVQIERGLPWNSGSVVG